MLYDSKRKKYVRFCIEEKMSSLTVHLPFLQKMMTKIETTPCHDEWKKLFEIITSNKAMSPEEISNVDNALKLIKSNLLSLYSEQQKSKNVATLALSVNSSTTKVKDELDLRNIEDEALLIECPVKNADTNTMDNAQSCKSQASQPINIKSFDVKKNAQKIGKTIKKSYKNPMNEENLRKKFKLKDLRIHLVRLSNQSVQHQTKSSISETIKRYEKSEPKLEEPVRLHQPIKRMISHMVYQIQNNILTHKCKLCNLEIADKTEFFSHIRSKHSKNRWFGTCAECSEPCKTIGSLEEEVEHMYNQHILREKIEIQNLNKSKETVEKITTMVWIPQEIVNTSNITGPVRLRPWITEDFDSKNEKVALKMLNSQCLQALYKCMGVNCCFYSSDENIFRKHMSLHATYQQTDEKNFSRCAYCTWNTSSDNLVAHIMLEHEQSNYQCCYCFFRSYGLQILTHMEEFHPNNAGNFICCKADQKTNEVYKLSWKECKIFISSIECSICHLKVMTFHQLIHHMKNHDQGQSYGCLKCKNNKMDQNSYIQHLKICYGFGQYQCCFCFYGEDDIQKFRKHMSGSHPGKQTVYFDRGDSSLAENSETKPKIATSSSFVKNLLYPAFNAEKIIPRHPKAHLSNEENCSKLSENYQIC